MKISSVAIKRPVTTVMLILMILVLGFVSLAGLQIDLFPDVKFPMAIVMTEYQGAGPKEIETLITKPLEAVMGTVDNFKKVSSTSSSGSSMVMVEFTQGTNMDFAALQMREKMDMIKDILPKDAKAPVVFQLDPDLMPIIQMGMTSGEDLGELKRIAEDKIKDRLERLDGVAQVNIYGGVENEIKIRILPQRMEGYGLSISQVAQALRMENLNLPGGEVKEGKSQFTVRTTGEFTDISEIENLPIATLRGVIHLKDIAEIENGFKDMNGNAYMDGKPCVMIGVQKQSGSNTVKVADRVNKELKKIKAELKDIKFQSVYDQSEYINSSIGSVAENAIMGGLLSIVILFIFLRNFRTTFIIATTIPISIIATFILIYFSGITINMMSLGGLALGIGNLVDNAIVIIESIFRYREEGHSRMESAIQGSSEVAMPVVASTLSTMAVFLPIAFIKDNMAIEMFREFALTVAFSQAASLIAALTLVPMMASRMLKLEQPEEGKKNTPLQRFFNGTQELFLKTEQGYERLLHWALGHRKTIIFSTIGLLVFSIVLVGLFTGAEFFPSTDEGMVQVDVELPKGTVLEETAKVMDTVEKAVSSIPEMKYIFVLKGLNSGAFSANTDSSIGQIYTSFGPQTERKRNVTVIMDEIRSKLKNVPGAKISIKKVSTMDISGGAKPISIEIKGDDLKVLKDLSDSFAEKVKGVEGTREVTSSFAQAIPEAQVKVDRKKAAQYNISAYTVANTVQMDIMGQTATRYKVNGDEIDVRVRLESGYRNNLRDLESIMVASPTGQQVPLYEIADIVIDESPSSISRQEQVRMVTVTGDISGRNAGAVFSDIQKLIDREKLPSGYEMKLAGQSEDLNNAMIGLGMAMLLAILLVYMIMASQFESLLHPFTIMFSVPLAFIGVAIAMSLAHKPFSVPAFIGAIMLVGIVTNNAIVLVDYINILRERGMARDEAICKAGPIRLRPILMTALATIIGSVPLALGIGEGAEQQAPLAITVIGGLSFSTLLTLVFIPVMYTLFDDLSRKVKRLFTGKPKRAAVEQ